MFEHHHNDVSWWFGRGEESQSNATGAGGLNHAQSRQIFCFFLEDLSKNDDHLAAENDVQNHGRSQRHHCDGSW